MIRRFFGIRLGVLNQHEPKPLNINNRKFSNLDSINLPSISIVTPSFNQGVFIRKTIESVLEQNYPKLQYLIQDGCSTDGTAEILESYSKAEYKYFIESDNGQADAINRGFSRSNGEIMAWLNSDDLLLPGALNLVGEYFLNHPEVDVIYGNRIIIDFSGNQIGRWILPDHDGELLRSFDYVPQETLFWRRRLWEQVGGRVDAEFSFALDWDLLLRFVVAGAKFAHIPQLFGAFRVHESQKTSTILSTRGRLESMRLRLRYGGSRMQRLLRLFNHIIFLVKHKKIDKKFEKKDFSLGDIN